MTTKNKTNKNSVDSKSNTIDREEAIVAKKEKILNPLRHHARLEKGSLAVDGKEVLVNNFLKIKVRYFNPASPPIKVSQYLERAAEFGILKSICETAKRGDNLKTIEQAQFDYDFAILTEYCIIPDSVCYRNSANDEWKSGVVLPDSNGEYYVAESTMQNIKRMLYSYTDLVKAITFFCSKEILFAELTPEESRLMDEHLKKDLGEI
jgi:hypothetical protein